jgi:hypothetical protein
VRALHAHAQEKQIDAANVRCKNPYIQKDFAMAARLKTLVDDIMEAAQRLATEKKQERIRRAAARGRLEDTMSTLLRAALKAQTSLNAVEKATGVKRQSLSLFVQGEQVSLRLPAVEKLAEYFEIKCSMPVTKSIKKERKNG